MGCFISLLLLQSAYPNTRRLGGGANNSKLTKKKKENKNISYIIYKLIQYFIIQRKCIYYIFIENFGFDY